MVPDARPSEREPPDGGPPDAGADYGDDGSLSALGDRLWSAARGLMSAAGCRTAKELSARLGVDGTTARRVVRMAADRARGAVVLTRSPSAAHLQKLANAARTRGVDAAACAAMHEAGLALAALLRERGVSRADLTRAIRGHDVGGGGEDESGDEDRIDRDGAGDGEGEVG